MSIIKVGNKYNIYPAQVELLNSGLPAKTYSINFHPMSGFSLIEREPLEVTEEHIYGPHKSKSNKIFNTYSKIDRNLGVLLSGEKGMGKTLTAKLLSIELAKYNVPTILVDHNYSGLVSFIESIEQDCLFIFDEFEKIFDEDNEEGCSQEELLSLFDGVGVNNHHLYMLIVNDEDMVNDYFINRPGRVHYHIKYNKLSDDDIEEYFKVNNSNLSDAELEELSQLSLRTVINYDILRAISFELSIGSTIQEAIEDLNITFEEVLSQKVFLKTSKGEKIIDVDLNLTGKTKYIEMGYTSNWINYNSSLEGSIEFKPGCIVREKDGYHLDVNKISEINLRVCGPYDGNPVFEKEDILDIKIVEDKVSLKYLV